jgi:hypothetical protein
MARASFRARRGRAMRETGCGLQKAVEENAAKSVVAAQAQDSEALLLADGDFLVHCEDCHKPYRDPGGGMMATLTASASAESPNGAIRLGRFYIASMREA